MAWSFEAKAGVGWAAIVLVLMLVAVAYQIGAREAAPLVLILPIAGWIAFFAWVSRLKK